MMYFLFKKLAPWNVGKQYFFSNLMPSRLSLLSSKAIAFVFLLALFTQPNRAQAQGLSPDFLCVTNDTLHWDLPTQNCGAFKSYLIYASQSKTGPYMLLATLPDPNQTSYFHVNAGSGIWYYYLQSDWTCTTQPIPTSDTLDNLIPVTPILNMVSVDENNQVTLTWEESPSPEVFAYLISKNTDRGTIIIDTAYNNNLSYIDTSAHPQDNIETYYLNAIDRCGNSSLTSPPQSSMLLKAEGASACDRTVKLSWNAYKNWQHPVAKYLIRVSENGGTFKTVGETAANTTNFTYQNANANIQYCFSVQAIESVTNNIAGSNHVCMMLDVVPGVAELILTNATVNNDDKIDINWLWNPDAAISKSEILRANGSGSFSSISSATPTTPLNQQNDFTDENANPDQGAFTYQIKTSDACDVTVQSNPVSTVFLQASPGSAGAHLLRWTDYQNGYATETAYELYRIAGNATPTLLTTVAAGSNEYSDQIDLANPDEANACYYVIAQAKLLLPDSSTITVESRSNTACLSQNAKLFIPNAFVPDGVNRIFRPVLQFGQPADYSMVIYDRWGGKVFETQSFQEGWDGRKAGKEMPQGAYTYHIKVTQNNGKVIERAGLVLLIR